jgi:hypothetical protein
MTPRRIRLLPMHLVHAAATRAAAGLLGLVDAVALARWVARQRSDEEMDALVEMLDACTAPGSIGVWS